MLLQHLYLLLSLFFFLIRLASYVHAYILSLLYGSRMEHFQMCGFLPVDQASGHSIFTKFSVYWCISRLDVPLNLNINKLTI